ncbi:MAG: hypothetical protein ACREOO_20260 [bacterium]
MAGFKFHSVNPIKQGKFEVQYFFATIQNHRPGALAFSEVAAKDELVLKIFQQRAFTHKLVVDEIRVHPFGQRIERPNG